MKKSLISLTAMIALFAACSDDSTSSSSVISANRMESGKLSTCMEYAGAKTADFKKEMTESLDSAETVTFGTGCDKANSYGKCAMTAPSDSSAGAMAGEKIDVYFPVFTEVEGLTKDQVAASKELFQVEFKKVCETDLEGVYTKF
jgi:hypothetical protein